MIKRVTSFDARFPLPPGDGADAIHRDPVYSYAVAVLETDSDATGIGLAFTLGAGNALVCAAISELGAALVGDEIESVMAQFGRHFRALADHPQLRWLGPHKGVVHLALAAITNACFDLWAKTRGVPLWRLLLDLDSDALLATLDLSYLEDVMDRAAAKGILEGERAARAGRLALSDRGYPGYDTSVGWFQYADDQIRDNCRRALAAGFTAMKLKVGSADGDRDARRARIVREVVGDEVRVMLDCNQQWTLPQALRSCLQLAEINPYWIEEPTHPDDILAHQTLARAIAPVRLALGEHVPNRILFKNYLQTGCVGFLQVDAVRVGGISEFITISLLARQFGVPVVPHVGDMGQIHQHLVLFNHIAIGHEALFLEYIPHLRQHFVHPAIVENGVYRTPQVPGCSADLRIVDAARG